MKGFKEIHIANRFYLSLSVIAALFTIGFFLDPVYLIAKILLGVFVLFLFSDAILLFFAKKYSVLLTREIPDRLSNGDENRIELYVQNRHPYPLNLQIFDEVPAQFQRRNFKMELKLNAFDEKRLHYTLVPKERGEYIFGVTNVLYATQIGLLIRHRKFGNKETPVPVYPSFLKMRKYELLAISNRLSEVGVKRVRRIGSHTEFDQIKDYVKGDNYRTINWRATAKRGKLMVNQYQDERSQNVYNVIDMGRTMQMPFNGMSLLDYAINASLILSNTAVQKHDKAGLITFNKTIESFLSAERKHETLTKILDRLYKQETGFFESDFAVLTAGIKRKISHRSLLILYTNFETITSLERYISYLRILAKSHVIIVVIFENEEIEKLSHEQVSNMEELYIRTIAEKHMYDKKLIVKELLKNGIYSVLTKPENLTAGLINKYLELKDTGRF
ncbi:DUF58 domain-containing protein [Saccharicrinis sp. FJH62]|uniref:DUF58 domain-containing protein n=1 Tax=Saccharicrinis sp. FJH62 TaxID=3344657 RepID=UPI0035D44634